MKKNLFSIIALCMCGLPFATLADNSVKERNEKFLSLIEPDSIDDQSVIQVLTEWESATPDNVDLHTAWFNYLLIKSKKQAVALNFPGVKNGSILQVMSVPGVQGNIPDGKYVVLSDSINGDPIAALNPKTIFVDSIFWAGINHLDRSLELNPDRLDVWFGKMTALVMKEAYPEIMTTAQQIIDRSKQNNNLWQWQYDTPLDERSEEAFSSITDFIFTLGDAGQNELAEQLADSLIAAYPQDLYYTLVKGQYYIKNDELDKAIENHENVWKGYKDDLRVAANLAYLYNQTGNTEKLLEICAVLEQSEEEEFVNLANEYRESSVTVNVDFFQIKDYVKTNKKEVQALTDRFIKGDETLTLQELSYIYFGHIYLHKNNNSSLWKGRNQAKELYDAGKYEECISLCNNTLKKHPVSLAASVYVLFCHNELDRTSPEADNLYLRSKQIGRLIHQGHFMVNGEDDIDKKMSPYCVLWRADEDVFFDYFLDEREQKSNHFFTNPVDFEGQ